MGRRAAMGVEWRRCGGWRRDGDTEWAPSQVVGRVAGEPRRCALGGAWNVVAAVYGIVGGVVGVTHHHMLPMVTVALWQLMMVYICVL